MPDRALAAIDAQAIARDVSRLVQVPSVTGDERAAMELFAELAAAQGLHVEVVEHDLAALRADPGHPGEEVPRDALVGVTATLDAGAPGAPRICLNGHLDVVPIGEQPWTRAPFSGAIAEGAVHGRGAADMKGAMVAALHALGAIAGTVGAPSAEVVLQAVGSEEDGGLGTFAALREDARFDAAIVLEPTAFTIAAAQAGALTFKGTIPGVPAHAASRLDGISAIERYVAVHQALAAHERRVNADAGHPLMAGLELPYPLLVGRVEGGRWSSQVPDRLTFEGRVGVRIDESVEHARAALEAAVGAACPQATIVWTGGQFAPGLTDPAHPFVGRLRAAATAELGHEPVVRGVSYGADMRLFCARDIPCVMFGTSGMELAHAVDERVPVDDLERLARTLVRLVL
jgi:acetylornithine deacetylase